MKRTTIWGTQLPREVVKASHLQLPSKYLGKTSAIEAWRFLRLATPEMKATCLRNLAEVPSNWRHARDSKKSLDSIFSKLEKFRLANPIHPSDLSEGYPYFVDIRGYAGLNEETKDNLDRLLWSAHGILVEIFKTQAVLPAISQPKSERGPSGILTLDEAHPEALHKVFDDSLNAAINSAVNKQLARDILDEFSDIPEAILEGLAVAPTRCPKRAKREAMEEVKREEMERLLESIVLVNQTTKETEMKRKDRAFGAIGTGLGRGMMTLGEISKLPEEELLALYQRVNENSLSRTNIPVERPHSTADFMEEESSRITEKKDADTEKTLDIFPIKFDMFIEEGKELTMIIPLAGAERKHIKSIKLVDSTLKITGKIPADPTIAAFMKGTLQQVDNADEGGRDNDARLLPRGDLRLSLNLGTESAPELDPKRVSASMKNGLLKIVLGIKQPEEVDIKITSSKETKSKSKSEKG